MSRERSGYFFSLLGHTEQDVSHNKGNDTFCRLEATKSAILPELVELTNDEESCVRLAGLETVVNVLSLLDDGALHETATKYNSQLFP